MNPMDNVDLESIALFAELAPADRANAETVARGLEWDAGYVVVKEGEFAFDFYAIKQGSAEVRQGGREIAVLGAGISSASWASSHTITALVAAPNRVGCRDGTDRGRRDRRG